MPARLGSAFDKPRPKPVPRPPRVDTSVTSDEMWRQVVDAINALRDDMADRTATPVEIPPVDLSDIVTAVNGLKPGATADDIAEAITARMMPDRPEAETGPVLSEIAKALQKLDFRLQAAGTQAYGGGASEMRHANASGSTVKTGVLNPLPVTGDFDGQDNLVLTDDQIPPDPWAADDDFTASTWVDLTSAGHFVFLLAGTASFDTVELEWSDDGVNPNGSTTTVANTPTQGFNVYVAINSIFTSGTYVRVHAVNGGTTQTAGTTGYVGLFSVGKYAYTPLIGLVEDLLFINEAILTRSVIAAQQPDGDLVNVRASGLARDVDDVDVTTTSALGAGGIYESGWVDSDQWGSIEVVIATDQTSATDGIEVEFTDDATATTPTVRASRVHSFSADDVAAGALVIRFPTELDGLRVRYTNGGTPQGSFFLAVTLRTDSENPQGGLVQSVSNTNIGVMTRGAVMAPNASDQWDNIGRGTSGGLDVGIVQHEAETPIKALQAWQTNQSNVGITAVQIVGSPLTNRKTVLVKNLSTSTKVVYIGTSSAVTASNGYELAAGEGVELDLDPTGTGIWAISASGTQRVAWLEIGGV